MNQLQTSMAMKHGTPEDFQRACEEAFRSLMITWEEYEHAVKAYEKDWEKAGKEIA